MSALRECCLFACRKRNYCKKECATGNNGKWKEESKFQPFASSRHAPGRERGVCVQTVVESIHEDLFASPSAVQPVSGSSFEHLIRSPGFFPFLWRITFTDKNTISWVKFYVWISCLIAVTLIKDDK